MRLGITQSFRDIAKHKLSSAIVVITFGLCIGLTTMIFSLFDSLLLNPNMFPDENRVVRIYDHYDVARGNFTVWGTSLPYYLERREQSQLIEAIGAYRPGNMNISTGTGSEIAEFALLFQTTPSLFEVLRVPPFLGRTFNREEGAPGNDARVVVLSHHYWKSRFGGNKDILGQSLFLDSVPHRIIGVMPEDFLIPSYSSDVNENRRAGSDTRPLCFIPLVVDPENLAPGDRTHVFVGCFARLKMGFSADQLTHELNALNKGNGPLFPAQHEYELRTGHRTHVVSVGEDLVRAARGQMNLLQVASIVLLLVGCVNISTFTLCKNIDRIGDIATRIALGASRFQIAGLILSNVSIFAFLGTVLGIAIAAIGLRLMSALGMLSSFVIVPRMDLGLTTVGFAFGVMIVSVLLVGSLSLLFIFRRTSVNSLLHESRRTASSGGRSKMLKGVLLFAQVAATTVILLASGLLLKSFTEILQIDPGFESENVSTAAVRLPDSRYDDESRREFMSSLTNELASLPFVRTVGISNWIPLKLSGRWTRRVMIEGRTEEMEYGELPPCTVDPVTGDFFEALAIKVLQGRGFEAGDHHNRLPVAVIDERIASTLFPGENPIGRRVAVDHSTETGWDWLEIVGVVRPVKTNNLLSDSDIGGQIFLNAYRSLPWWAGLVIKTEKNSDRAAMEALNDFLARRDPYLAIAFPETMGDIIKRRYSDERNLMIIVMTIGVLAALLSALGIFGSIAHSIASQTKEIGIRMALGANRRRAMLDVTGLWVKICLAAIFTGGFLMSYLSPPLEPFLYATSHLDAFTYATITAFMGLLVVGAAYFPARAATRISPSSALRHE